MAGYVQCEISIGPSEIQIGGLTCEVVWTPAKNLTWSYNTLLDFANILYDLEGAMVEQQTPKSKQVI